MSFHKSRTPNIYFLSLSRTTYVEYFSYSRNQNEKKIFFFLYGFVTNAGLHRYTYSQNVNDSTIVKYLQNVKSIYL